MIEKDIQDMLEGLAAGGVHFDVAPAGTSKPYITLQQVGGTPIAFLEGDSGGDIVRIQVEVFGASRTQANAVMSSLRQRLCGAPLNAEPVGSPFSDYEASVNTYRRSCDFYLQSKS